MTFKINLFNRISENLIAIISYLPHTISGCFFFLISFPHTYNHKQIYFNDIQGTSNFSIYWYNVVGLSLMYYYFKNLKELIILSFFTINLAYLAVFNCLDHFAIFLQFCVILIRYCYKNLNCSLLLISCCIPKYFQIASWLIIWSIFIFQYLQTN